MNLRTQGIFKLRLCDLSKAHFAIIYFISIIILIVNPSLPFFDIYFFSFTKFSSILLYDLLLLFLCGILSYIYRDHIYILWKSEIYCSTEIDAKTRLNQLQRFHLFLNLLLIDWPPFFWPIPATLINCTINLIWVSNTARSNRAAIVSASEKFTLLSLSLSPFFYSLHTLVHFDFTLCSSVTSDLLYPFSCKLRPFVLGSVPTSVPPFSPSPPRPGNVPKEWSWSKRPSISPRDGLVPIMSKSWSHSLSVFLPLNTIFMFVPWRHVVQFTHCARCHVIFLKGP